MTQTSGRLFDELAKMMTNAAGAAQGLRAEAEQVMRTQAERILHELDVVQREEFEAVKDMAAKARAENDRLSTRIAALEAQLGATSERPAPARRATAKSSAKAHPKAD